jgi:hypothetical protein
MRVKNHLSLKVILYVHYSSFFLPVHLQYAGTKIDYFRGGVLYDLTSALALYSISNSSNYLFNCPLSIYIIGGLRKMLLGKNIFTLDILVTLIYFFYSSFLCLFHSTFFYFIDIIEAINVYIYTCLSLGLESTVPKSSNYTYQINISPF